MNVEEYIFLRRHIKDDEIASIVLSGASPKEVLKKRLTSELKLDGFNTPESRLYDKRLKEKRDKNRKEFEIFYGEKF